MIGLPHSEKCKHDLIKYWDIDADACKPCKDKYGMPRPGKGFAANCGFDDDGGQHEPPIQPCEGGRTFNNGSFQRCQKCSECAPILEECSTTTDTKCCLEGEYIDKHDKKCKEGPITEEDSPTTHNNATWPVTILLVSAVLILFLLYITRKKWMKKTNFRGCYRGSQCDTPKRFTQSTQSMDDIIEPDLQAAPLQHLLNNLDVVEELVVLLDPDTGSLKNTRHLAARCHFQSSWITYAYSRRDCKSPLVAMLEATATKSPDWTVGELVGHLLEMGRRDAVEVLKKLSTPRMSHESHYI
ncbi:IGF-like family receptor 1 isoform X2 [Engraulis encrasicolus]|uniref:IGF-like family receptor 1 isoform X2 n=1 Tax=Engraulis encrasicolus TaxID=184585 RepID=UPI002FD06243